MVRNNFKRKIHKKISKVLLKYKNGRKWESPLQNAMLYLKYKNYTLTIFIKIRMEKINIILHIGKKNISEESLKMALC